MQIQLRWVDPKTGLERNPTLEPPIAFGRTFGVMPSDLDGQSVSRMVLDDSQVEDYHAVLEIVDGQLSISDRGSRVPTKVNGVALPYQTVSDGDRIQIGSLEITVAVLDQSVPSSSPDFSAPAASPPLSTASPSGFASQPTQASSGSASSSNIAGSSASSTDPLYAGFAGMGSTGSSSSASEQFGPDGRCDRKVGFLFKRRCGRTTTEGCQYCQNGRQPAGYDPYTDDYGLFPGYGYYGRNHWGYHYYADRDRYYYDPASRRVDFTEADGQSFEEEADQGYEMDLEAS